MYVKLARFLALRPHKVLAFWICLVIASALVAVTGFGTPLWERLVSDVPQATPSESNIGQKILESQATGNYGVIAYVSGIDLTGEVSAASGLEKRLTELKDRAESQGDKATALGEQAKDAAKPAQDLGNEATALANRAQSLGTRAKTLGARAKELGGQAKADGELALTLKKQAEDLGVKAQAAGERAAELQAQAQAAGAQAQAVGAKALELKSQAEAAGERAAELQAQAEAAGAKAAQLVAAGDLAGAQEAQAQAQKLGQQAATAGEQAKKLGQQAATAGATAQEQATLAKGLGTQAATLGAQAKKQGDEAQDLGEQAASAGKRAQEAGDSAQTQGAQAKNLGAQAKKLGNQARSKGDQARDQGKVAQDLGERAKDLGDEAKALGDEAKALAEPDWPIARALHEALVAVETDLKKIPEVKSVSHPFVEYNAMLDAQARELVAEDGRGFVVVVNLDLSEDGVPEKNPSPAMRKVLTQVEQRLAAIYNDIAQASGAAAVPSAAWVSGESPRAVENPAGTDIRADGDAVHEDTDELRVQLTDQQLVNDAGIVTLLQDLVRSESIGIPLSFFIMALVFGGFAAALLPLGGALVAISAALAIMLGMTYLFEQQSFAVNVISVMGLGLSIDYGLLIVSRFREELARLAKLPPSEYGLDLSDIKSEKLRTRLEALNPRHLRALEITLATAGRTTFFSALTVSVASSGMLFFRPELLKSLGIAGASVVLLSMVAALTLVSALMFRFATALEKPSLLTKIPGLRRLTTAADPNKSGTLEIIEVRHQAQKLSFFDRFAAFITRWSWPSFIVSAIVLVLACLPLADLHLRNSLLDLMPLQNQQRLLLEDLNEQVPRTGLAPIQIVAKDTQPAQFDEWLEENVADIEGVSRVFSAAELGDSDCSAMVRLDTQDAGSHLAEDVVHQIRNAPHEFEMYVTGQAANQIDFVDSLVEGLPWVLGVLVTMTFILLFLMTGSVVIPLQALVINTLSLVAALGISTLVFVDGWGAELLGAEPLPGLESYVVVMLMCFGFGLSMDYELFLLSRMKEIWDATGSAKQSVIVGLSQSARIVTSAATILVFVFLCFVTGRMIVLKEVGFILALAVAFDATIVRMILVPSVMAIFGRANWWAPAPLRRWHDRVTAKLGHIG